MSHKKIILIAEDEPMILLFYKEMFTKEGFDVLAVSSGEAALTEYSKRKPDIILTDIRMPGMSGIELLKRIRQKDKSTPVLIVTAYTDFHMAREAFNLGADDYINKVTMDQDLIPRVKELINKSALEKENDRLRRSVFDLTEENKDLVLQLAARQSDEHADGIAHIDSKQFKAFCGAIIHGLKGEFLHIGDAVKSLQQSSADPLDIQEESTLIERSVEYSQLLLRRLVDYLEIGKPKIEPTSVAGLIKRIELLVIPRLPSSVQLEIKIDPNVKERTIYADIEQLVGVLLELISNASNALREKGGLIELSVRYQAGKVLICVKDNGPGISESMKKDLFKQQVSSKRGLGLGLYLSGQNIVAVGGKLRLEGSSSKGTTLTVLLPADTTKGT